MTVLNSREQNTYTQVKKIISRLPSGVYYAKDFFPNDPTCPRVIRKLFEEVSAGIIPGVTLVGTKSEEGYIIT